jgi:phosphohistidine phosphatase
MKQLILVRHAKAETLANTDFERVLHAKGHMQCAELGMLLVEKKVSPNLIISSDAHRTKETAILLATSLNYQLSSIRWEHKLYNAHAQQILDVIVNAPSAIQSLMIVGHNNGISEVVNHLAHSFKYSLPTAGVVGFACPIQHWTDLLEAKLAVEFEII